jgi:carbonic anhydrase
MLNRRLFCGCLAAASVFSATAVHAQSTECAVITPDRQKSIGPDESVARLKSGNQRFASGKTINCDLVEQVKQTSKNQSPHSVIVGCIDSRVPPEMIFDQKIGDVFSARVAGNFVNTDIIGSLEFATKVAGAKSIIILGHTSCGAIKGAVDGVKLGNLTAMLRNFEPALATLTKADGKRDSKNDLLVQKVADANARLTAASLLKRSAILKQMVADNQLKIVSAMHDLKTGQVTWL